MSSGLLVVRLGQLRWWKGRVRASAWPLEGKGSPWPVGYAVIAREGAPLRRWQAGWLATGLPGGAACLTCCIFFLFFFFEDHLFTPHPASPRSPVTVSPQGESLGVWSRGPGVLGKSALPRPSCKAKKGAEQEAGVCFARALGFFSPWVHPWLVALGG